MPDTESNNKPSDLSSHAFDGVRSSEGFLRQDEEFQEAADKALKDRPYFSIRLRLILAFSLFFLFPFVITLWTISTLSSVHEKILFLEIADDYKVEIQQARRFEKNFLLYGTNLEDAREHALTAQQFSAEHADQFRKVVGEQSFETMNGHLSRYLELLNAMKEGDRTAYEAELREQGSAMFIMAQDFAKKERKQVDARLHLIRRVPFYFFGVLLVLMAIITTFLARYIISSLNRYIGYTARIAAGDFTPIMPARGYRDEFTELALHVNRMVRELDRHQRILIESHKLRALGTLVAGVAHELNNPVNNIMLTASLLQEQYATITESDRDEMLQDLVSQADRSKNIVANLLNFARVSESQVEPLDLREIIKDTVRLLGNQTFIKKIRLITDLPDELPAVHSDRQLLTQVLTNLILNAVDALPPKGEIRISIRPDRREGFLSVDVSDNGPGIPDHIMNRIFDPFFTTKPKGKGTGLGLSVSRSIVHKLGGYLLAESALGAGTTFTVLLPTTTIPSDISSQSRTSEGGS